MYGAATACEVYARGAIHVTAPGAWHVGILLPHTRVTATLLGMGGWGRMEDVGEGWRVWVGR